MTFREDVENAVRGGVCAYLNTAENIADWAAGLELNQRLGNPVPGAIADFANGAVGLFCDQVPQPVPPPETETGQCNAVVYNGSVTWTNTSGQSQTNSIPDIWGPVTEVRLNGTAPATAIVAVCRGSAEQGFGGSRTPITSPGTVVGIVSNSVPIIASLDSVTLNRVDGLPDDCGGEVPRVPPDIPDRTFPVPIGPDPGTIVIGLPDINFNGDIYAPITITGPSFSFSGTVNFSIGLININFDGLDPDNNKCCLGPPEVDIDLPPELDPPPEDETEQIVVGAIVRTTTLNEFTGTTRIFQGDNPTIHGPNLGYINFRLRIGSNYAWSADIPIKNTNQYVENVASFDAVDVEGTPRQGVTWVIAPVKARAESVELT